jgi:3-deoxy-D-manno-octulosonate 8-phosphate phosphatase (KDO 8-P phosphatase)
MNGTKLENIKIVIMDVDGTLTDGFIIIDSNGVETKHFNVKDGMGITLANEAGLLTGIISSRSSTIVEKRALELKINIVKQGCKDKVKAFKDILDQFNLVAEDAAYIGDDINDLDVCMIAGVSFAVNDAADELKSVVDYVLAKNGGHGAVREAICNIINCRPSLT